MPWLQAFSLRIIVSWPVTMLCSFLIISGCFLFCLSATVSRPLSSFGPVPMLVLRPVVCRTVIFPSRLGLYLYMRLCPVIAVFILVVWHCSLVIFLPPVLPIRSCRFDHCDTEHPVDSWRVWMIVLKSCHQFVNMQLEMFAAFQIKLMTFLERTAVCQTCQFDIVRWQFEEWAIASKRAIFCSKLLHHGSFPLSSRCFGFQMK